MQSRTTGGLILGLALAIALTACSRVGGSKLNPFNWFGGGQEITLQDYETGRAPDPRGLVAQVVALDISRTPGGAIITARGLPPTQGYWQGSLVADNDGYPVDGVLSFQFRISAPPLAQRVGPQRSREVVVARTITEQKLAGVSTIRVNGAANAMIARR